MKRELIILLFIIVLMCSGCNNKIILTNTNTSNNDIDNSQSFQLLVDKFCQGEVTYEECEKFYKNIDEELKDEKIIDLFSILNDVNESKNNYVEGKEKYDNNQLVHSYQFFDKVIQEDIQYYNLAIEKKNEIIDIYCKKSDKLAKAYYYEEAIANLEELNLNVSDSDIIKEKLNDYKTTQEELVLYEDEIYNIFFHSLIVFNKLAFDGDYMSNGYNYWMTTVTEFKKMLQQMYERDFILIDVNMIYDTEYVEDKPVIKKKDLYLPKGKKPVILSLDDLSYYEYMETDGFADRLVLDDDGNVATYTKLPDGGELIARDNDCVPIVDAFIEEHPDFSYKNAKGIIALTGYEGILGYRTDKLDSPTYEKDLKDVQAIVQRLKETGWLFASHSYGHINFSERSIYTVKQDTKQWNEEVGKIVGETNLFIYPYGAEVSSSDERFIHLKENGFQIFFGVGNHSNLAYLQDAILMDRCNLDGFKMHYAPKQLEHFFDVDSVIDRGRPEFRG